MILRWIAILAALAAAAEAWEPAERSGTERGAFVGLQFGGGYSAVAPTRLAVSGWGAAFGGEFGYRLPPLVVPYVAAGASWGKEEAPEWERWGYEEEAYYLGIMAYQVAAGALYYRALGGAVSAYGGPALLWARQRREAMTFYGAALDQRYGSGLGWAGVGGVEIILGRGHGLAAQILYGQTYGSWADLPAGAEENFTFEHFRFGGGFRFAL